MLFDLMLQYTCTAAKTGEYSVSDHIPMLQKTFEG